MIERISIALRSSVAMVFWSCAVILSLLIHSVVVLANYMGCATALDLLGTEPFPLGADTLLGTYIAPFLSDATLSHLLALTIAVTIAWGLILLFHLIFQIWQLILDRRVYLARGEEENASAALSLILRHAGAAGVFLAVLAIAITWDITLFQYRSTAGALGLTNPVETPMLLDAWHIQLQEHSDLFAWSAIKVGAWGYLAVTVLACLGLEFSAGKVGESAARFMSAFRADSAQTEVEAGGASQSDMPSVESEVVYGDDEGPHVAADSRRVIPLHDERRSDLNNDKSTDPPIPKLPASNGIELIEVFGAEPAESVSLATAAAIPDRYVVDLAAREVWSRPYWNMFNPPASNEAA